MHGLSEKGIRLTVEAEEWIKSNPPDSAFIEKIIGLDKPLVSKEDLVELTSEQPSVEVIQPADFVPLAKEYDATLKIDHAREVTGKSRTRGDVENFVNNFRNRYERLAKMLRNVGSRSYVNLADIRRSLNDQARVIVLVSGKRETKKGNLLLEVEDLTGSFKIVVSSSKGNEKIMEKAGQIILDDVIAVTGKVLEAFIVAQEIEWPDMPVVRERKSTEADIAVAYLSDLHFGSRYFLDKQMDGFANWLHGRGEAREFAGKVKYLCIAGDIVDGIGIYPNQEKDLLVKDIYKQYGMFQDFLEKLPDYLEIIVGPGNHDAVRRGEPQPAIPSELFKADIHRVSNPCTMSIDGFRHLMYHGTSIDSLIATVPGLSYTHPERVMVEYLKRRHLSPSYGGNPIVPENIDYMVVEEPPDVLHCGHVHKNGYTKYRGTVVINSGTFQDRTDFQIKQGHVPTPCLVPVYELKFNRLRTLDFSF